MTISPRLHRGVLLALLGGAAALSAYSLADASCNCTECCSMSTCHAFVSSGNGKQCYLFSQISGKCLWNFTGGGNCWSPCNLVTNGQTDVWQVGNTCTAYCYDYYGSDCEAKWNEASTCGSPSGPPNQDDVTRYVCQEYISS